MTEDRISKPKADRYFPYDQNYLRTLLSDFAHDDFAKRISLFMENCEVKCQKGFQLCTFFRGGNLATFSLPSTVPAGIARAAMDQALSYFKKIDAGPELSVREQQFVVFRAFFRSPDLLTLSQHVIDAGHKRYLSFRSARKLSKAYDDLRDQTFLFETKII